MKTANNTLLITGGTAGIGFEIAKLFSERGNQVIITGRDADRLKQAVSRLKNTTGIVSDVTDEKDVEALAARVKKEFPSLNILINNAGYAVYYKLQAGVEAWKNAQEEMNTNYISLVRLTDKLLPLLQQQPAAAVVNVSSIVAYAPGLSIPTYSASKAAVNAYTKILRLSLRDTSVKVFELMPPLVNTEFSKEIGGATNGIPPAAVAEALAIALEKEDYSIHVGNTAGIYELTKTSPIAALHALNGIA